MRTREREKDADGGVRKMRTRERKMRAEERERCGYGRERKMRTEERDNAVSEVHGAHQESFAASDGSDPRSVFSVTISPVWFGRGHLPHTAARARTVRARHCRVVFFLLPKKTQERARDLERRMDARGAVVAWRRAAPWRSRGGCSKKCDRRRPKHARVHFSGIPAAGCFFSRKEHCPPSARPRRRSSRRLRVPASRRCRRRRYARRPP